MTAVIDPFLGSGSTLIAVDNTHRVCPWRELDPLYVDVIVRRYESATDNRGNSPGGGANLSGPDHPDLHAARPRIQIGPVIPEYSRTANWRSARTLPRRSASGS